MSSLLESKYIGFISSRLPGFVKKHNNYNFRCVICGDSKSNKNKKRGYLLDSANGYRYYCQNCSASFSFRTFLKDFDPSLYNELLRESLKEKATLRTFARKDIDLKDVETKVRFTDKKLSRLTKVSDLPLYHPAHAYMIERKIPEEFIKKLYYTTGFKAFTNSIIPGKFDEGSLKRDEARIIIPFLNQDKELFGFQGRSLDPDSKLRYITIVINKDDTRLYGLERIDFTKTIYAVEGPFDSMFIDNGVATCGGEIVAELKANDIDDAVVIYDNEPRSIHTVGKMTNAILNDYRVFFWPKGIEHKDINDCIKAGHTPEEIKSWIDENTHRGLAAKLRLAAWKKI